MNDRKREFAKLLAHDTIESTKTRLEAFADAFERWARTAEQRAMASEFSDFIGDYVHQPLGMGDLSPLNEADGFAHELQRYAERLGGLSTNREFKELAAGLGQFAKEFEQLLESWKRSEGWLDIAGEIADRIKPEKGTEFDRMVTKALNERPERKEPERDKEQDRGRDR